MRRRRNLLLVPLLLVTLFVGADRVIGAQRAEDLGSGSGGASVRTPSVPRHQTQAEREAAAERMKLQKAAVAARGGDSVSALSTPKPGGVPDYISANWAFSPPLRKFVDTLPGLGATHTTDGTGPNNLGQYLSVAHPDTITFPGSDYYEIELREYTKQMHSDLPPTTLRGYVQVNYGTDPDTGLNTVPPDEINYLGPVIIVERDRPVRIKFTNALPTGEGGDLFIPVDTTVMGAGMGPLGMDVPEGMQMNYTQNRATLHLHGGRSPWISDGTPHQWITPANENTPYPEGVSVVDVPDMFFDANGDPVPEGTPGATTDPGEGSMTFYYSNQQSARFMFYHDHSYGITRLNVYSGEAAGYLITDPVEQKLVDDGLIPAEQIPLIVQDKTFVDASTIRDTDPTWAWGTGTDGDGDGYPDPRTGDLWMPHVYVPAQNPYDISGMNPFGRWHYGPWFWPPTQVEHGPVPNPYYDPVNAPWQPPEIPGTPHPSMGMESFFDTALVNGTAFPTLEVDPKSYRFRILNAANDRFFNLQLYKADPSFETTWAGLTEVKMVPASSAATNFPEGWPTDGREGGVPDPTMQGPDWIQIGNEGGFLPMPAVVPNQPITWNLDPTTFNFGNVDLHSLLLAPAERADVVVDFSDYAGQTLILYNDAPTAFPALDPRTDYYTGSPNMTDTGGYWGTEAGHGPNTRTVMQIKVRDVAPAAPFDLDALRAAWASTDTTPGVFESSQDPIIVGQAAYNTGLNKTFSSIWPLWGISRIHDTSLTFQTVQGDTVTLPMQPKAIQDEMGEAFDTDYGRMSGFLGLEMPQTSATTQNFMLYPYASPPVELLESTLDSVKIGELGDGTQIWKITHNGVDTHPIHFHLYDVQLINRVGWDNGIRLPDENEIGWKETLRVSPLEDTIVALRPKVPDLPFDLPNSVRLIDPTMPEGAELGMNVPGGQFKDPSGEPVFPVLNKYVNYGWEFVVHCHILSHEEMDMMHAVGVAVTPRAPSGLVAASVGGKASLSWNDNSANEVGFVIERAANAGFTSQLTRFTVGPDVHAYVDATVVKNNTYYYRVFAENTIGDGTVYDPAIFPDAVGFPTKTVKSALSNTASILISPKAAIRIAGATRYDVAVNVGLATFPGWTGVTDVVIASGEDAAQADALSASGLAGAYNAPLLLVQANGVPTVVRNALIAMPPGVNVHIVGGTASVSTGVFNTIDGIANVGTVDRIAGANRYEVAANVARRMALVLGGAMPTTAIVVNGADANTFFDALAASPIAASEHFPILLVQRTAVPAATNTVVQNLGLTTLYIVGGPNTVNESVRTAMGVPAGNRIYGQNRYAGAVAVATKAKAMGWLTYANVGVTATIPDSLAGGVMLGLKNGPLTFTASNTLSNDTRVFLQTNKAQIDQVYVFGGTNSVSNAVVTAIDLATQ